VDLDASAIQTLSVPDLCKQITCLGDEQEVAIRGQKFFALRLAESKLEAPKHNPQWRDAEAVEAFEMKQGEQGRFESLYFAEMPLPHPAKGQLVVEMAYSSLHFKDLMKVMGLLSDEALSNTYHKDAIGMEGSGIVTEVGEGVSDYAVGDRVYVWGPVIRSHALVDLHNVVKLPDEISLEAGANLVTYFTVYHSFVEMARLQAGESVLIHSATGGVGLAAINIARHLGARIFTTAGTPEKRAYLETLGVDYVGDSRSLDFVEDVRKLTAGQGVDVVLNFTPGEIMKKSVDCLSASGRFIELGKQSSDKNEALRLRPFLENLSYMSVDFDRLTKQRPVYVLGIVKAVLDLLVSGELPSLPCQVFTLNEIDKAFRTMARSSYIGKLALRHDRAGLQVQVNQRTTLFANDATYVITGGLGGFGLQVAQWMAQNGAGHLALLSRRGASSEEAQQAIADMRAKGVQVNALAVDVSDLSALTAVWQEIEQTMPPVKGVMHAAMVLDDKKFTELDLPSLQKVVAAKATGAWNLHQLTQNQHLDFMILFSSISSLVGNAGQANYVAANNFLDQLAHYRQSLGLAATSINWGVFEETGVVARNSHLAKHLNHMGIVPFSSAEATQALAYVVHNLPTQIGIMHVDWSRFSGILADGAGKSRFNELLLSQSQAASGESDNQQLLNQFAEMDEEERQAFIQHTLIESVASVMRLDVSKVKPASSLRDLGLDSLMAVEIDVVFSEKTGLDIPSADISSGPRIEQLAARLLARLNSQVPLPEGVEV
jgi:NADPH:quinone reductase-like Zn-dependent oxidoreductase/NAD(P)-dependent dehydrogenase (short-subunit alcohol dehydrogenase family)/acyl carrier protein